jgi:hypothetical protein
VILRGIVAALLISKSAFAAPAIPVDPVIGILDAFKTHDIVALGEGRHGNQQDSDFRLKLIRDPRFAQTVNDIMVECGAGQHQVIADRFTHGDPVPDAELRLVWQDTTQAGTTCDRPIYADLFRTVRAVNAALPPARRMRVLLGDTPIDWHKIEKGTSKWERTDAFPADLIEHEVLAKHRKALIVYGGIHFLRKNPYWPLRDKAKAERDFAMAPDSIVTRLEAHGAKLFSIYTEAEHDLTSLDRDIARWPVPSLAILRETSLGQASFTALYPFEMMFAYPGAGGKTVIERVRADPARSPRIQDEFDALLYLGPTASITMSKLPAAQCADPGYLAFRRKRLALTARFGMADANSLSESCPGAR